MPLKIFIVGLPGCGKTTLIKNILHKLSIPSTGFYTEEIRESGTRTGFLIKTLDGKEIILSSTKIKSKYKVSKYYVNIEGIEKAAIPSLQPTTPDQLIIIDEIGKMECLSEKFREIIPKILNYPNPVLATLPQKGTPFIESLKNISDVIIFQLTATNRDDILKKVTTTYKNSTFCGLKT